MCDKRVAPVVVVCVCVPHRLRCTVGNEGIRSREQINLPEDNEIISHLQLLDEKRKWCVCVHVWTSVCKRVRESLCHSLAHVNGVTLKTMCRCVGVC